ncbi:MAG: iron chelate uptake ABC transporter family permease subunit [Egibacteraceae bacterium]
MDTGRGPHHLAVPSAVGAAGGVGGRGATALVRNPLAHLLLLGVSSGASLGAVIVLVLGSGRSGECRCRSPLRQRPGCASGPSQKLL